jgi:hypothetical protein
MTDPVTSGGSDAPSADNPAPAAPAGSADTPSAEGAVQPPGTFGKTRGSGLVRGKHQTTHAAASVSPKSGDYLPTAVEVIIAQREYKNPFGGAVTAPTAGLPEEAFTAPAAKPQEPRKPEPAAPAAAPVAASAPVAEAARLSHNAEAVPAPRTESAGADAKSQLKILPPAETKRTQYHWDKSHSAERDRPQEFTPRPRRDDRREERPSFRGGEQRQREDARPPKPSEAPSEKPLGFIGRLKRWLGLGKPSPAAGAAPGRESESDRGGDRDQGYRRRRRGGRGHNGGERNEHGGMPQSQRGGGGQSFDRRDGDQGGGGQHRRRHRGGRGRNRGGPRPEGQQGGGYI